MAADSRSAVLAALFANAGIAIAKFVAFLFTGAASMLAESIHSVADSSNQGLLLLGQHRARLEPSADYPFGYARERYFWAFAVSVVLFALGGLFSLLEGLQKLRHPHEITSVWWAVGVLVMGIVLEAFSLRTAIQASDRAKGRLSWWSFIRKTKQPELPVVLLEDIGALLGLVAALVAVGLAAVTGDPRFDALGSLVIGILLAAIAAVLALEMKGLLIGESARPEDIKAIRRAIEEGPHVRRLIDLKTQHLGPEELLIGARVEFDDELDFREMAKAIDTIERHLRELLPASRHLYLEPQLRSALEGARDKGG
ncbi:MAG: cation diffusion facilitator family transporter [Actinomycetota bacterium]|nr:cation diffusion facilitator family transporter [Actinomycetota bacterium]